MSTAAARTVPERRRSLRVPIRLELIVTVADALREQTCTFSVSAHGVLVPLGAAVTIGQRVTLHNPQNWAERKGRVARMGRSYAGRTEVGIEFVEPAPDFWFIDPSSEHVRSNK